MFSYNIIPHLHNLLLFQCDVTRSLNRYKARSKLFIDQGRTPLCGLFWYIGQYRLNAVFTSRGRLLQHTSYDKYGNFLICKKYNWSLKSFLNGFDFRPLIINMCWFIEYFVDVIKQKLFFKPIYSV